MPTRAVWLGPPGSGKTTRLIERHIAPRVAAFADDFRLIVPTSTMAEHVRNTLARRGLTVRTGTIATVAAHATELAPDARVLNATVVESHLAALLNERAPDVFAETATQPGLAPRLAAAIEELANSGCDAYSWQALSSLLPGQHAVADALGTLWVELQQRLEAQGWITRHAWLQQAAQALHNGALPGVEHFYWDGFARIATAELDLIRAQSHRASTIVALPAWSGAARSGLVQLRRERFAIERFHAVRAVPARTLLTAATIEDEVTAIVHRVRADHAAGTPWHDIALVVRSHDPYVPLLKAACARFGVPVRPYFAASLTAHAVARFFDAVLRAVLSEWNWETLLEAVTAPVALSGRAPALPAFDYLLRTKLPGTGLDEPRRWAATLEQLAQHSDNASAASSVDALVDAPLALNDATASTDSGFDAPWPDEEDVAAAPPQEANVAAQTPQAELDLRPLPADTSGRTVDAATPRAIDSIGHAPPPHDARITALLDQLAPLSSWREELLTPREWGARLAVLPRLLAPPEPASFSTPAALAQWRTRAAAVRAWFDALDATADLLEAASTSNAPQSVEQSSSSAPQRVGRAPWPAAGPLAGSNKDAAPISLAALLDTMKPFLREAAVRDTAVTRDAVRLIDAQEARQWELPVVHVCGVLEGQFPRFAAPDSILGEDLRARLRRHITLRTRSARDAEERFLFEVALTRATTKLTLSYPRTDASGEPTLPAFALQSLFTDAQIESAPPCDLAAQPSRAQSALPSRDREGAGPLDAPLAISRNDKSPVFTPSKLETYLECPFHYFAEHTLQLKEPPARPSERFDALARGSLVHQLIAQYHRLGTDLLALFHTEWNRMQRKLRVPASYRLEVERALLERSLRMYVAATPPGDASTQHVEEKAEMECAGATVKGRVDRYETTEQGAVVYDYKFSRPSGVAVLKRDETNGRGVQAGLYLEMLTRAGLNPVAFYYVALKGACARYGWNDTTELKQLASTATAQAERAIGEILSGRADVAPIDEDSCAFCAFKDACRIREIGYARERSADAASE